MIIDGLIRWINIFYKPRQFRTLPRLIKSEKHSWPIIITGYILSNAPEGGHHGDHGDHGHSSKEHEEKEEPEEEAKEEEPKDEGDSEKSDDAEESDSGDEGKEVDTPDTSDDEGKEETKKAADEDIPDAKGGVKERIESDKAIKLGESSEEGDKVIYCLDLTYQLLTIYRAPPLNLQETKTHSPESRRVCPTLIQNTQPILPMIQTRARRAKVCQKRLRQREPSTQRDRRYNLILLYLYCGFQALLLRLSIMRGRVSDTDYVPVW